MLMFNGQKLPLKYLYTVRFKDGSFYEQNQDDISITNPEKSCFYDILEQEAKQNPPEIFCLAGENHTYIVDLKDGHFEIDNVPFRFHDKDQIFKNIRLIFCRRRTHKMVLGGDENELVSTVYRIGWQGNDETGKNHQFVMEVD